MRKLITSILIVFISIEFSTAQDWSLFPLNKKLYYEYIDYSGKNVDLINCDSVVSQGASQLILNRSKVNREYAGNCYDELMQYWQNHYNYIYIYIDTLYQSNDTITFNSLYGSQSLYFLPGAQTGNSWSFTTYSQITITCAGIGIDTVLGIPDSIKTFTLHEATSGTVDPVDNHVFILSKHFGLINFIPFEEFFNHPANATFQTYELAGVSDSTQSLGFRQPDFSDYFPYQAGDILLWNIHFDNGGNWSNPNYDEYHRDSITSVFISPDSVSYVYDSKILNRYGQLIFTQGSSRQFTRAIYGSLFSAPPFSVALNYEVVSGYYRIWLNDEIGLTDDTVVGGNQVERKYLTADDIFDTASCFISLTSDYEYNITFNDHLGKTKECTFYNTSSTCETLIAASLSGHLYGNLQLPVGIPDLSGYAKISSYPLPANNVIYFDLPADKISLVEIYNALGKQVLKMSYTSKSALDISALTQGIYFARISGNEIRFESTIVKAE